MFNLGDHTFERVPKVMSVEVMKTALQSIESYAADASLKKFSIALHGGEPSLWPADHFEALIAEVEQIQRRGIDIDLSLQTNGLRRLDKKLLDLFASANVRLGISVDGPKAYNDSFRVRHNGSGSYDQVMANVEHLFDSGYGI